MVALGKFYKPSYTKGSLFNVRLRELVHKCVSSRAPLVIHQCRTMKCAKLFVEDEDGKQYTLKAYTDALTAIVLPHTISENLEENLIDAPPFQCIFNKYHVIKLFSLIILVFETLELKNLCYHQLIHSQCVLFLIIITGLHPSHSMTQPISHITARAIIA